MNKRQPLSKRISKATGVQIEVVEEGLAGRLPRQSDHWGWGGQTTNWEPVMSYEGRCRTVRRLLYEAVHGPLEEYQRVMRGCTSYLCVNPAHSFVKLVAPRAFSPVQMAEQDRELGARIIQEPRPWIAEELSCKLGAPLSRVNRALAVLEEMVSAEGEQEDSLEDVVYVVYMRDPPWDAHEIAERSGYPLEMVEQAIKEIGEGKW